MPHFFASDLAGLAIAFLLGIPVIMVPGYAFGWLLNPLGFRSESPNTRWAWAVGFGLAFQPILLYLPFRLISSTAMLLTFAGLVLGGVAVAIRTEALPTWKTIPRDLRRIVPIALLLGCLLLLDVGIDSRLYPPSQIVDTSFRSQVITVLSTANHLPPNSPFFNPGHPTTLRYHYVLFLLSGLFIRLGHGLVTARIALIALTLWIELAMLVVVAISIRFMGLSNKPTRAIKIAWSLLLIGGLDILPVAAEIVGRWARGEPHRIPYADVNFWNGWGMAFDWINTLAWSPHHLSGLMGCVLGCLFLWHSRGEKFFSWKIATAAALAFASAAGSSIYVAAIFGAFLLIVTIEILLNAPRYLGLLITTFVISTVLASSFLLDMRVSAGIAQSPLFLIAVRPFAPVVFLFDFLRVNSPLTWNLTYFLTLPINYLMEFGFLLIAGIWWIYDRRRLNIPFTLQDHLAGGLLAISLILPSLIWSGMEYSNDFGYRGVLPAQFVLLLWATEIVDRHWRERTKREGMLRRLFQVGLFALILGFATNLLNLVLMRFTIGNFEKGTVLPGQMLRPSYSPERFADVRTAYLWIQEHTPKDATVQENPVTWQLLAAGQYSQRPAIVYGSNPSFLIGTSHSEYLQTVDEVRHLFQFGVSGQEVNNVCKRFKISYLIVQDDDSIWADRNSYVWRTSPVFEDRHVRVFTCDGIFAGAP